MKIFFDTEFTGLHQQTTLISIGLISDDNKTFYAEFTDYDTLQVDDWVSKNVLSKLQITMSGIESAKLSEMRCKGNTKFIKKQLEEWLAQWDDIEIWSDCLSYDWVLFNSIWGNAFDIPKHINYIPRDISTLFVLKEIDPDISREEYAEINKVTKDKHNSLWDAKIIKKCYEKLIK